MEIILRRAEALRRRQKLLYALRAEAACGAVCAALLVLVLTNIPSPEASVGGMSGYGSLILWTHAVWVVIGVLSFGLGICVTLLCQHLRKMRETERNHGS